MQLISLDNSFCLRSRSEEQHQGEEGSKSAAKSSVLLQVHMIAGNNEHLDNEVSETG